MNKKEFWGIIERGEPIVGGTEAHALLVQFSNEALRITAELNGSYHEPEEVRSQGKRTKILARQHVGKENVVAGCSELFLLDTHFGFLALQKITSYMPENGKVFRSIAFPDPAFIFSKSDIKHIMKSVFYAPMRSDRVGKELCLVFLTRNIVPALCAFFVLLCPL